MEPGFLTCFEEGRKRAVALIIVTFYKVATLRERSEFTACLGIASS